MEGKLYRVNTYGFAYVWADSVEQAESLALNGLPKSDVRVVADVVSGDDKCPDNWKKRFPVAAYGVVGDRLVGSIVAAIKRKAAEDKKKRELQTSVDENELKGGAK